MKSELTPEISLRCFSTNTFPSVVIHELKANSDHGSEHLDKDPGTDGKAGSSLERSLKATQCVCN